MNATGKASSFPRCPSPSNKLTRPLSSFPYYHTDHTAYLSRLSTYFLLRVGTHPDQTLGLVLPSVAEIFRNLPAWSVDEEARTLTLTEGATAADRSAAVARTTAAMRATGHFRVLERWRGELYPVYARGGELLFDVERAASPLFGVVTYGVHLTAYVRVKKTAVSADGEKEVQVDGEEELKIWIPRRARSKQTYAGMLDQAVAGGIASGEAPFESLVRECAEEASLGEKLVRAQAKACGTVTYFYVRDERAGGETNLMQPECQYVYDLELPEDVVPKPGDDEVEEFYLWSVEEVQAALAGGEFKPNCALVMLDFFVRHGIINCENEKNYIELVSRLHRHLEFPTL